MEKIHRRAVTCVGIYTEWQTKRPGRDLRPEVLDLRANRLIAFERWGTATRDRLSIVNYILCSLILASDHDDMMSILELNG